MCDICEIDGVLSQRMGKRTASGIRILRMAKHKLKEGNTLGYELGVGDVPHTVEADSHEAIMQEIATWADFYVRGSVQFAADQNNVTVDNLQYDESTQTWNATIDGIGVVERELTSLLRAVVGNQGSRVAVDKNTALMTAIPPITTAHHDGHGLAEQLAIHADEPGNGGARHSYVVHYIDGDDRKVVAGIQFQNGPRGEKDSTPGIIETALYAIILDRLEAFQNGPYPSPQGARQIELIKEAMAEAKSRANERAQRGVLGKNAE